MYELKTILPQFQIDNTNCMYKMKRILFEKNSIVGGLQNGTDDETLSNNHKAEAQPQQQRVHRRHRQHVDNIFNLDMLEQRIHTILKEKMDTKDIALRQEYVLQQLQDLKRQLADMRTSLGVCAKPDSLPHNDLSNGFTQEQSLTHDIVINAHPQYVPYGLLALRNAWRESFIIEVHCFTHSTIPDISQEAKEFERQLNIKIDDASASGKPKVKVHLIWKNCEHTEMIGSPTLYVPIYGEVNIIRYLGRVGPLAYRYEENSANSNVIDAVLDICYQLLRCNTEKRKALMLRDLSQRLGKQKYFGGGEQLSIADIGVNSALKRLPNITAKQLQPNLVDWLKRVQRTTLL